MGLWGAPPENLTYPDVQPAFIAKVAGMLAEGLLPAILVRFKALSDFQGSQAVLKRKAGELKLYDYTM